MDDASLIEPQWPAPGNVRTCISTRLPLVEVSGRSKAPYEYSNMGLHVGDASGTVAANRQALLSQLGLTQSPQWLEQIHGNSVVEARADERVLTADGSYTRQQGLACVVMTADCLPVLLCDKSGAQVAAVHAGWRGLAKGVLANAVSCFDASPDQLLAYLGPAISARHFEVGAEVLETFFDAARNTEHAESVSTAFMPAKRPLHFYADIYALARAELTALGVNNIYGGDLCTYADQERFYSYRRDGQTGRMASLIWLDR